MDDDVAEELDSEDDCIALDNYGAYAEVYYRDDDDGENRKDVVEADVYYPGDANDGDEEDNIIIMTMVDSVIMRVSTGRHQ